MYRIIDEQAFAGGLTLGVMQAFDGVGELVGKFELQGAFGTPNMEANRHLLPGPWKAVDAAYHDWQPIPADIIISNPPCSGFSLLSSKAFRGPDSKINSCMWGGIEYVAKVKPELFLMESVQGAFTSGHELMRALRARLEELTGLQYDLTHVLHSARACGSSQLRRRYFFVAHRIPFGIEPLIPKAPLPTTKDAIGDLESLTLQWEAQYYKDGPQHPFAARARYGVSMTDGHMDQDCLGNRRLRAIVDQVGWGEGEDMQSVLKRLYEKGGEFPDNIVRRMDHYIDTDFACGWNAPGRLRSWHTTPVMTGSALTSQLHYNQPRNLTHREVARLMGFPDDWRLAPLKDYKALPATHGKGVTVNAGRWIGEWLRAAVERNPGTWEPEVIGDREYKYNVTQAWKDAAEKSELVAA